MAKKKKVTFSLEPGDCVDEGLRGLFRQVVYHHGIPRGELLSRGMYLACLELEGEQAMEYHLRPTRDIREDLCVESKVWRARSIRGYSSAEKAMQSYERYWSPIYIPK